MVIALYTSVELALSASAVSCAVAARMNLSLISELLYVCSFVYTSAEFAFGASAVVWAVRARANNSSISVELKVSPVLYVNSFV